MAPQFFGVISDYLKSSGLTDTKGFKRLVIEKPFGSDLKSAEALNNQIRKSFKEEEIYRIDHYLGKDMVPKYRKDYVLRMRCLNHYGITNIFQTSKFPEILGVEDRGGYYESSGALKIWCKTTCYKWLHY